MWFYHEPNKIQANRKCISIASLELIHVKSRTLKICPNISEVQPAITWLAYGIIWYRKKVIQKLYSNNSTETGTQRCSTKNCYSEKNLFCSTDVLDLL